MLLTLACAYGLRTILPKSMPAGWTSNEYFARPDTFCGPSILDMRLPIKVRLSASGHLYSAIAPPSFLRCLSNRSADAHVGSASAEIPAQPLLDLLRCRIRMLIKEGLRRDDKARS